MSAVRCAEPYNEANVARASVRAGEGGPKARPFDIAWARQIVAQCKANKTPVFVKQMGSHCVWTSEDDGIAEPPYSGRIHHIDRKGGEPAEWHADLRIQEFPT